MNLNIYHLTALLFLIVVLQQLRLHRSRIESAERLAEALRNQSSFIINELKKPKTTKRRRNSMLILSATEGKSVIIDNSISVKVLSISGNQVKLGFDAPKEVVINRKEIQDKINAENNQ